MKSIIFSADVMIDFLFPQAIVEAKKAEISISCFKEN